MCSNEKFYFAGQKKLVIFLPGHRRQYGNLQFLKNFIINKKFSLLYLPYRLTEKGKRIPIKKVAEKLVARSKGFLLKRKFNHCYIIGYSLGAALALKIIARRGDKFSGLIMVSTFDDRKSLLLERGIKLPDVENISPVDLIRRAKGIRTLIIHGLGDKSVAPARAASVFKNSNKKITRFVLVPGDHHFHNPRSKLLLNNYVDKFLKTQRDF